MTDKDRQTLAYNEIAGWAMGITDRHKDLTQLMLTVARWNKDFASHITTNISATIKSLFTKKENFIAFLRATLGVLSKWQLIIIRISNSVIIPKLKTICDKLNAENPLRPRISPKDELVGYNLMLITHKNDVKEVIECVKNPLLDKKITAKLFYRHINKAFRYAMKDEVSLPSKLNSALLLNDLQSQLNKQDNDDEDELQWLSQMFTTTFNYLDLVSATNKLNKYKLASKTTMSPTVVPTFIPPHPQPFKPKRIKSKNAAKNDKETAERRENVKRWLDKMKVTLKDEYTSQLNTLCAFHHAPGSVCFKAGLGVWQCSARRGRFRIHSCLCGSREHKAPLCKVIFK